MLADGVISGERVGRAWLIDSDELRQFQQHRPEVGRPWSPSSAWAVLALAEGRELDLSAVERSRARKRLALGLDQVAGRLVARAERHHFYAHLSVLDRLGDAPDIVRSGISAASEHGADLLVQNGFEGYVRAGHLGELVMQFGLDGNAERPNVVLRAVDDAVWPFDAGQVVAGRVVVAVDLLESGDPRSSRAGKELLVRL